MSRATRRMIICGARVVLRCQPKAINILRRRSEFLQTRDRGATGKLHSAHAGQRAQATAVSTPLKYYAFAALLREVYTVDHARVVVIGSDNRFFLRIRVDSVPLDFRPRLGGR